MAKGAARLSKEDWLRQAAERVPEATQAVVRDVFKAVFDVMREALAKGDVVSVRDLGTFELRGRNARMGRNPRTGELIPVKPRKVVTFHCAKSMIFKDA